MMSRLVLVGLPGTGKTTIGEQIAAKWQCDFIDTDSSIATTRGRSVPEVLGEEGEPAFRRYEFDALVDATSHDAVVATGGGVVCTPEARVLLKSEVTLWLDCDDGILLERVKESERPLLSGDPANALRRLREQREKWYQEVSRARIDTSGSLDDVTRRVELSAQEVAS